uniref:CSON001570 protein n=1 Tax=Culicoides sonorensis TaxID=179676 RepID=A0A336KG82_CULSO
MIVATTPLLTEKIVFSVIDHLLDCCAPVNAQTFHSDEVQESNYQTNHNLISFHFIEMGVLVLTLSTNLKFKSTSKKMIQQKKNTNNNDENNEETCRYNMKTTPLYAGIVFD